MDRLQAVHATQCIVVFTFLCLSLFSDEVKSLCKIRDEYFVVKDLVPKESLTSNRNPVTGAYPSNQGTMFEL